MIAVTVIVKMIYNAKSIILEKIGKFYLHMPFTLAISLVYYYESSFFSYLTRK